jgi:DNA polymerase-4
MSAPERAILHVDMDPELRGKPLIVGGTAGRGVVAAASYEVRCFGVRSAMPIGRALQLCPQAICVRPRMARYKAVSNIIFSIFEEFTPLVEGLSLDEAFLDVTASRSLHGDAVTIARQIKQRIREQTGLAASVGVAANKLVAKIASDLEKPDGLTVVTPERVNLVLDPLPVKRLPGLGRKKGDAVIAAGIATLGDLRRADDAALWRLFGRDAQRMRDRAAGLDNRAVHNDHAEQSVSAEETFSEDISNRALLDAEALRLADRTSERLRSKQLVSACVQVKIRQRDFSTFTRQRGITPATNDSRRIAEVALTLLRQWLTEHPQARIRLLGVGASELGPATQLDLFDAAQPANATRLDSALDGIREKFGAHALRRGSALKHDDRK